MSACASSTNAGARHPRRGVAVFAFFAILGAPLGGLALYVILFLPMVIRSASEPAGEMLVGLLHLMLFFFVMSYLFGGLAGVLAGAWLGWRAYRTGSFGFWEAVLASGVAAFCGIGGTLLWAGQLKPDSAGIMLVLSPIGIAAGIAGRSLLVHSGVLSRPPNHDRTGQEQI